MLWHTQLPHPPPPTPPPGQLCVLDQHVGPYRHELLVGAHVVHEHMFVDVAAVLGHHHGGCIPLLEQRTHAVQHSCVGRQALQGAPACNRLRQM